MSNIEKRLQEYRENKAMLMFKQREIEAIEQELEFCNQVYFENESEAIEGMQMSAVTIKPDVISPTNKISSATENTAANYRMEARHENNFDVFPLKKRKEKLEKESISLKESVDTVEILMTILGSKEKFVVNRKYFREYTITEIVTMFAKTYGYGSKTTVERIIDEALKKMDDLLNKKSA